VPRRGRQGLHRPVSVLLLASRRRDTIDDAHGER